MPTSKHRRKGKLRPRDRAGEVDNSFPPRPVTDPEDDDPEDDALLMARLRKMYGGNDWRDWTDAQIDAAIVELSYEQVDARIKQRVAEMERAESMNRSNRRSFQSTHLLKKG
jgi:hypothetical protein